MRNYTDYAPLSINLLLLISRHHGKQSFQLRGPHARCISVITPSVQFEDRPGGRRAGDEGYALDVHQDTCAGHPMRIHTRRGGKKLFYGKRDRAFRLRLNAGLDQLNALARSLAIASDPLDLL